MKTIIYLIGFLACFIFSVQPLIAQGTMLHNIYSGGALSHGYDMGVNTSEGMTHWITNRGGQISMSYPSGQNWGAVFITVGRPQRNADSRQTRNYSTYDSLIISMKGAHGGEVVEIGIKDKNNPDDGSETKISCTLTRHYKRYAFALSQFTTADLQKVYVVTEFVFGPDHGERIYTNYIAVK